MQFTSLISLLAAFAVSASAANIHVNYYTDGGCSSYASSPPNVPTNGISCYNWNWTGANSANIADCNGFRQCSCLFFTQDNCQGAVQSVTYGGNNCASNWGHGFVSFRCQGLN